MKLKEIAQILGNSHLKVPEAEINWLLTDSRALSFSTQSLFFALRTRRNDGHRYIRELYDQHLRYFVVSETLPEFEITYSPLIR